MILYVIAGLLLLILLAIVGLWVELVRQLEHGRLLFSRVMVALENTIRRLLKDPTL